MALEEMIHDLSYFRAVMVLADGDIDDISCVCHHLLGKEYACNWWAKD